jgi:hypothetical protein
MSDTITDYKVPKRVRLTIACVYLTNYIKSDDQGVIAKAREVLDRHNIELDVFPDNGQKYAYNTLDYGPDYIPDETEDYQRLYDAAKDKIRKAGCNFVIPIPVVFGMYQCSGYGIAPRKLGRLTDLIMISGSRVNDDKMTLLHEIGHAAGLEHDNRVGPPRNFMHEADVRTVMYKYQVEKVAKAPFAVG